MESSRIADHKAFQQAKSDDEQAVTVLGSAIDALGAFYKNNDVEMARSRVALKQRPSSKSQSRFSRLTRTRPLTRHSRVRASPAGSRRAFCPS